MARSLVPSGFECTSHKIFFEYINPLSEISIQDPREEEIQPQSTHKQKNNSQQNDEKGMIRQQSEVIEQQQQKSEIGTSTSSSSHDQDICSICLSTYENPVTLVSCHHSYCLHCLLLWLIKKPLCPLCKSCGKYFIQTNRYSSSSSSSSKSYHDIKVLSVSSTTQKLSSTKVSRAIAIHRKRFSSQKKTSSDRQSEENARRERMRVCESWRQERAHRRYGDGHDKRSRGESKREASEEEEVDEELEQISRELNETAERLHELDQKILVSQKKRKLR